MTEQKSFKRLVRARMEKTGESYTTARARLLRADRSPAGGLESVKLSTSDETIRRRTGRGWEEWFEMLDQWGAPDQTHRETARWLAERQGLHPLAWNVQAVAAGYERARGLREVGEKDDGFAITASRTVAVPVEQLYDAVVGESRRREWLPDGGLRERTATRPKSARFDWRDGDTRVNVSFLAKGDARSTAALEHRRLPNADEAERMKADWRERLTALKITLER
ncbi:MAG: hypothetical protein JO325_08870 [Solirubrobacterales bacterium]|nr:hypothetical protein [Solirubrobacterales bacterium]